MWTQLLIKYFTDTRTCLYNSMLKFSCSWRSFLLFSQGLLGVKLEWNIFFWIFLKLFCLTQLERFEVSLNFNACARYSWKEYDGIRGICQLSESWFFWEQAVLPSAWSPFETPFSIQMRFYLENENSGKRPNFRGFHQSFPLEVASFVVDRI